MTSFGRIWTTPAFPLKSISPSLNSKAFGARKGSDSVRFSLDNKTGLRDTRGLAGDQTVFQTLERLEAYLECDGSATMPVFRNLEWCRFAFWAYQR